MIVGVTGTRSGLSRRQRLAAEELLAKLSPTTLHHGDCVGVDAQLHEMALHHGIKTVIHPPDKDHYRAHCVGDASREPQPYLVRNREIVNATTTLLAFPDGLERARSGTWATVRYAQRCGKRVLIIHPGGQLESR